MASVVMMGNVPAVSKATACAATLVPSASCFSSSPSFSLCSACTDLQPGTHLSLPRRLRLVHMEVRRSAPQQTSNTSIGVVATSKLSRADFPAGFLFGTATSAFQVEGHTTTGGKGMSIWDAFVRYPGNISNGDMPTVACNFYELYPEDIKLMKEMGCDTVRFSIAWSRIIPNETGEVSQEGIAFYNGLINEIIRAGMKPFATIYHWDLPLYLESDPEVCGWRTKNIVKHYTKYAETCFQYFGDRVKNWITFNEPFMNTVNGYAYGCFAPGRCSAASGNVCFAGDSAREPYLAIHHMILSHASAYRLYQEKYKKEQGGLVGYTANGLWFEPYSDSLEDKLATKRYLEFTNGWQMDPLFFGDYPKVMRDMVGDRLPKFTEEESKLVKGTLDFLGLNYYNTSYVKNDPTVKTPNTIWYFNDMDASTTVKYVNIIPIGEKMGSSSSTLIYKFSKGIYRMLVWAQERWGDIPKYITQNSCMDPDANASANKIVVDSERLRYLKDHVSELSKAIKDGCNVKGYFVWPFMDNFEWAVGYSNRYGLFYVDFNDPKLRRIPKESARWYAKLLTGKDVTFSSEKLQYVQENPTLSPTQPDSTSNGSPIA